MSIDKRKDDQTSYPLRNVSNLANTSKSQNMDFYCGPKVKGVRGGQFNFGCDQGNKDNLVTIRRKSRSAHDMKTYRTFSAGEPL